MNEYFSSSEEEAIKASEEASRLDSYLGAFILTFADTERVLYQVLLHYAKVSDAIGRSIFSGVRAGTMMDFISAIVANTKISKERTNDLALVFEKLAALNTMRDSLIHRGFTKYFMDGLLVTNADRVSRYANKKVYKINSALIGCMIADLEQITSHLACHLYRGKMRVLPFEHPPWLYKPPQPRRRQAEKSRESHREPRRQRSSSRRTS